MSDILKSTNSELPQTPTTFIKAPPSSVIKSAPVKSYRDDEKFESFDESIELDKARELMEKLAAKIQISDDLKEASVEPQASDNESTLTTYDSSSCAQVSSDNELELENDATISASTQFESETQYMAEVNPSFYSQEMDDALDHVRQLASYHQESFVHSICDTFVHMNGSEPSVNDLVAVFNRIQSTFADEAIEEELEQDEVSDSDSEEENDSDYDPNSIRDRQQLAEDAVEDTISEDNESESELEELSDSDYDPQDIEDLEQAQFDADEDAFDSETESVVLEYDAEVSAQEEDAIINLASFDAEYFDAIRSAQIVAKFDAERIVENIKNEFNEEYGEEYVEEAIDISLSGIRDAQTEAIDESDIEQESEQENENEEEQELEEVDVAVLEQEMYWALDNVRKLAKYHQQEFVEKICDIYAIYNGFEPNADEISSIFSEIKEEFAYEAADEILEECDDGLIEEIDGDVDVSESESDASEEISGDDSDYDPSNELDVQQHGEDEEADWTTDNDEEQSL